MLHIQEKLTPQSFLLNQWTDQKYVASMRLYFRNL